MPSRVDGTGHPGQPGNGLLDEHISRPTRQAGGPRPRRHLHRQDAVAAQFEERVVDPDPLDTKDLGVDTGEDLLDRIARRAVLTGGVFRCR